MSEALTYKDIEELGAGEKVYVINQHTNLPDALTIVEVSDEEGTRLMLQPISNIPELREVTISFMKGIFFATPEEAICTVSERVATIFTDELMTLGSLLQRVVSQLEKLSALWFAYQAIKLSATIEPESEEEKRAQRMRGRCFELNRRSKDLGLG
jgi:hypothetical protein